LLLCFIGAAIATQVPWTKFLYPDVEARFRRTAVPAPERFMRAVAFGLTGSDDAEARVIDRKGCVFGIGENVYRLNAVYGDKLVIHLMGQMTRDGGEKRWVRVELHGASTVFEHGEQALKEHTPELSTEDQDRVERAWDFIYGRYGCEGKESP
jgi:hypothetical protein